MSIRTIVMSLLVVGTIAGMSGLNRAAIASPIEPLKISGTLGEKVEGNIFDLYKLSPNGQRVVYTSFNTAESKIELYSVLVTGGSAVKLSRDVDGSVFEYQISPDSSTVVYRTGASLYSVPTIGGMAARVDSAASPHDTFNFRISAIDNRVVYTSGVNLYSAPTNGMGAIVELSTFMFASQDITNFQLSSDGSKVLFIAFQLVVNQPHIYVAPIAGGPLVEIGTSVMNLDPLIIRFADGGNRVVFSAYFLEMGVIETGLFSEALTGAITRLDDENVFNTAAFIPFIVTPDGSGVIYAFSEFTPGVDLLKIVPAVGGATILLNNNADVNTKNCGFKSSPTGSHVAYCAKSPSSEDRFLYTVSTGGGSTVLLNSGNPSDGAPFDFKFSPDGERLGILINNPAGAMFSRSIYSGTVLGSSATQVASPNLGCLDGGKFQFTGDNSRIVYCSFMPASTNIGLAATSIDGEITEQLTGTTPPDAHILFFEVVTNQNRVVFLSQSVATNDIDIYSVEIPELLIPELAIEEMCFPIVAKNGNVAMICI